MTKAKTLADTVSTGGPLATPGAVNLPGGAQGSVPYQSAAGVTALLAPGTAGHVLTSGGAGANPTWAAAVTAPAGSTGQVQINNAGAFGAVASGTSGQVLTSAGSGAAPTWTTPSSGALVFISSVTASNSATVSFTGLATYNHFMVTLSDVKLANATSLGLVFSADNGATYISSSYFSSVNGAAANGAGINNGGNSTAQALLSPNAVIDAATTSISGTVNLFGLPSSSVRPVGTAHLVFFMPSTNNSVATSGFGQSTAQTINAVGFRALSGNITSGTFRLYGVANS